MKKPLKPKYSITTILAVASFIVVSILAIEVFQIRSGLRNFDESYIKNIMETSFNHSRLQFCYDNNIHPCVDSEISEWNQAHPEEKFWNY